MNNMSPFKKKIQQLILLSLMMFCLTSSMVTLATEDQHDHDIENEKSEHKDNSDSGEDHENHEEHEDSINLSEKELNELGIKLRVAERDSLNQTLRLSGEINLAPDRLTHIVPRVSGVTREVHKSLGDRVNNGDLLATLSSRELAEIKAEIDAAKSRYALAKITYSRERKLKNEGITSEDEYLQARQLRDAALIEYELAKQKLQAIGVSSISPGFEECTDKCDLTIYEIRSPADGVIIEKHIVDGELMNGDSTAFLIADLNKVWVILTIYQKDLQKIHLGQKVIISAGFGIPDVQGMIDYISPIVSEETRSATARVIINNEGENWRPGLFVSAEVFLTDMASGLVIPRTAIQMIENKSVVFIKKETGFSAVPVETGRSDQYQIEILSGLTTGDEYVSENAFVLKAEMQKEAFGDGHGH